MVRLSRKKDSEDTVAPRRKRRSRKRWIFGVGGGILLLVVYIGLQPLTGTIKFGICRAYVERTVTYPPEMRILSVEERTSDVRMEYAVINEYGEYIVSTATCTFRTDPANGYAMTGVTLNRMKVPPESLGPFNATIPFILANPPSLVLPPRMPESLAELKR